MGSDHFMERGGRALLPVQARPLCVPSFIRPSCHFRAPREGSVLRFPILVSVLLLLAIAPAVGSVGYLEAAPLQVEALGAEVLQLEALRVKALRVEALQQTEPADPDRREAGEEMRPRSALDIERAGEPEARVPLRGRLMLLAGVSSAGVDGRHGHGGIEAGLFRGRFGVVALGQYGSGNGYQSLLLAGGPAVEVANPGFLSLTAYGGVGRYEERRSDGFDRNVNVGHVGMSIRVPLRFLALGFATTLWQGTLDGEGIGSPASVRGHRFSIGVGL